MASHQISQGSERSTNTVDFRQSAGKTEVQPTSVEVVHQDQTGAPTTGEGVMASVTGMAVHAAESAKNAAAAAGVAFAVSHAAHAAKDAIPGHSSNQK
ncbi:hypothetical protein H6P81_019480 [Aristolochia fimbriata]|uniref:Uncharacterized protein n=1 Tax=Aristolochia fimbriata TaxID=158543 RepID=A0AAV7DTD4_ARIFI|nr:hypothetical protein H6P81_019480 [Aristolochia fimbriata]